MYKIYADDTLIYDSTVDDYKIGGGDGTLETNKAGSFTFTLYPDHFYYNRFTKKKTVITVKKSEKILFRGRVLDDSVDYWNRKKIVCEGELNFFQDSIIRPFNFTGTPEELFAKFVTEHNAQVDAFKQFRIGTVTVIDPNNYIARSNTDYETALSNLNSRLLEDATGGYLHITHGDDGTDPIPTIHYLADFTQISTQAIEFGVNLMDYLRKNDGKEIATAIIPLGAEIDNGDPETENPRLTIADVNNGTDYVYDADAVAAYGWIFETVIWDDVTVAANLKTKAVAYLRERVKETVTVELTALDLHLLDRSIESFSYDTYVRTVSTPHNFADTLLCHKQTFHILKPENDTITLGGSDSSFTGAAAKTYASVDSAKRDIAKIASAVGSAQQDITRLDGKTSQYRIAEQKLTSLLAQSFGVFKTEEVLEDGSTVCYLHDKPTMAASQNIWKMTGDVFAVSSDGGATWNAGMDANGNAIMNILSVIGINASWINTENLSSLAAQIGPWSIDDDGLFYEGQAVDPVVGTEYRVKTRINASKRLFGDVMSNEVYRADGSRVDNMGFSIGPFGNTTFGNQVWIGSLASYSEDQKNACIDASYIGFVNGKTLVSDNGTKTAARVCWGGIYADTENRTVSMKLRKAKDSKAYTLVSPTKMCFTNENEKQMGGLGLLDDGTVFLYMFRTADSEHARTFISPTYICFANDSNQVIGGMSLDSSNKVNIFGDIVRSGDGYTGNITLGGIKFTFTGGILTAAGYE